MVRIVVVGDVHNVWNREKDLPALRHLKPDLVLFTGDFGNEDVKMVQDISQINMPKAVILGNHDCWWSSLCAEKNICLNQSYPGAVADQIKALGENHVGFKRKDFNNLKLSVVGARPFSLGGGDSIFGKAHVSKHFGVKDMEASTKKITELVLGAPRGNSVVILAHNGPTGLGSKPNDICGTDFDRNAGYGDSGDPDLEEALKRVQGKRRIPLVVFGHMHKKLAFNQGNRKMTATKKDTVFVNAAVVPRERNHSDERQFTVIELDGDDVDEVKDTWVRVTPRGVSIAGETVLHN